MSTETRDLTVATLNQAPGWSLFAFTGETIVLVLTVILLLIQIGYYIHRWVRHSTAWGLKIKEWAGRMTKPVDLDE